MNTAVRLYADAANAKTKLENGFDLTDYDERTLKFAREYSEKLLAIDVNIDTKPCLRPAGNFSASTLPRPRLVSVKNWLINTGRSPNDRDTVMAD
jgi:V/A-type H+/Na+-transporting ATPase subunit B